VKIAFGIGLGSSFSSLPWDSTRTPVGADAGIPGFGMTRTIHVVVLGGGEGIILTQ
jgi:hypothetical protein